MKLVIIESPYAGDAAAIAINTDYARRAMADALNRGEAPYASHLLYTQPGVLDDAMPDERALGINAGLAWGDRADATVVYADLGMTSGMAWGVDRARAAGRDVVVRFMDAATCRGCGGPIAMVDNVYEGCPVAGCAGTATVDTCSQCGGPMPMVDGVVPMCPNGCAD